MKNIMVNLFLLCFSLVIGGFIFLIWEVMTFFGLDIQTLLFVFILLLIPIGIIGMSWWMGDDFDLIKFNNIWPVILAFFWVSCWPVLDYCSSFPHVEFLANDDPILLGKNIAWWSKWYIKVGVFISIIGLGYVWKRNSDRY